MIKEAVDNWFENKDKIRDEIKKTPPRAYRDLVDIIIKNINDDSFGIDHKSIHEIGGDDYSGVLVFVIACTDCLPENFYYFRMYYGSCCVCDTLESITQNFYNDEEPKDEQLDEYMMMGLHIVQALKKMDGEIV